MCLSACDLSDGTKKKKNQRKRCVCECVRLTVCVHHSLCVSDRESVTGRHPPYKRTRRRRTRE